MPWPKGRPHSTEHRARISAAIKNSDKAKAHRVRIRPLFDAGSLRPEVRAKAGASISAHPTRALRIAESKRGQPVSDEHRAHMSVAAKNSEKAKVARTKLFASPESRAKISAALKGRTYSRETLERMGRASAKRIQERVGPFKDTSIERAVERVLITLGLRFVKQHVISVPTPARTRTHPADFFLPDLALVIEADGDYWHSRPDKKMRDAEDDAAARALGYRVVRLTETRINANAEVAVRAALEGGALSH